MSNKTSEQFSAADADVVFISTDGVEFEIHRKYLETMAGAFPPAEFPTSKEPVPLSEPAVVLEMLFQFVYPGRHPDVETIESLELFAELAEAAEKYDVYPAISVCKLRMRAIIHQKPILVLSYATRHGYMSLADQAAQLTLAEDQADVVALLPHTAAVPYLKYIAAWERVRGLACSDILSLASTKKPCIPVLKVLARIGGRLESIAKLDTVFDACWAEQICSVCSFACSHCRSEVEGAVAKIPKFSMVLNT